MHFTIATLPKNKLQVCRYSKLSTYIIITSIYLNFDNYQKYDEGEKYMYYTYQQDFMKKLIFALSYTGKITASITMSKSIRY